MARVTDEWIHLVDDHQPHTVEAVVAQRHDPLAEESTVTPTALAPPQPASSGK